MNNRICPVVPATLAVGSGLFFANMLAMASGFSVPELSALGTGAANAVVANPEEIGTFAYNPSAMGFHEVSSISLGTVLIKPDFEVTTDTGRHNSENAAWFATPIFQAALKIHEQWRLGLGVSAPFGLETRWPLGSFPISGSHPTESKLETVAFTPTLIYKVNDELSLSAGLDYYKVREAKLNSQFAEMDGDGDAFGWNASLLYRHDAWSLGASFHSAATVDLDSWYRPLDQTLVDLGVLYPEQSASLDLNLPWRLQLGVRYAANDKLAVEFDWTRIGWSEFDRLELIGSQDGLISSHVNDWKDANAYRLGLTYDICPTTQLRFGYSYDETGQSEEYFNPRVPDNDRHLFAIGIRQDIGQGWALEGAYMHVNVEERNISNNNALDGDYDSSVNLLALEVNKTF